MSGVVMGVKAVRMRRLMKCGDKLIMSGRVSENVREDNMFSHNKKWSEWE